MPTSEVEILRNKIGEIENLGVKNASNVLSYIQGFQAGCRTSKQAEVEHAEDKAECTAI